MSNNPHPIDSSAYWEHEAGDIRRYGVAPTDRLSRDGKRLKEACEATAMLKAIGK